MAGLVGPFIEVANPVTSVAMMAHGRTLARMRFAPEESPYPLVAMVPQDVTEKLLVEQLQRRGGSVEYETSFVSAVEHEDRVGAVLDRKGQRLEVDAAFVVGCDGAHSTLRHLLDLPSNRWCRALRHFSTPSSRGFPNSESATMEVR